MSATTEKGDVSANPSAVNMKNLYNTIRTEKSHP